MLPLLKSLLSVQCGKVVLIFYTVALVGRLFMIIVLTKKNLPLFIPHPLKFEGLFAQFCPFFWNRGEVDHHTIKEESSLATHSTDLFDTHAYSDTSRFVIEEDIYVRLDEAEKLYQDSKKIR